jgi:predicted metal-dependent hydrolase
MGTEPLKIAVKTQKRIWGSCHPRTKTINLNWMLVLAPLEVIDYVVVHELSHLDVPNHSRRFWKRVSGVMPDYRRQVQWLKEHAAEMVMP